MFRAQQIPLLTLFLYLTLFWVDFCVDKSETQEEEFYLTELKWLIPEECAGDSDLTLCVIQVSFLPTSPPKTNTKKHQKPNFGKHSYLAFRKSKLNTSTTEGMDDILVIHL